jgi:serine/threonine protein kinase/CHASE2 domain-containing sensor protein
MSQKSSLPQAETLIADSAELKLLGLKNFALKHFAAWRQIKIWDVSNVGHGVAFFCALTAGLSIGAGSPFSQLAERQLQSRFFNLRGAVAPPENIIIVKMDEYSISQAKTYYTGDPKKYAYLEPLTTFPWKRKGYAQAIDYLMKAGARYVGIDVIFDLPSGYGVQDDLRLQQTLQQYAGRITLPFTYTEDTLEAGVIRQINYPQELFRTKPESIGSINYPVEANGEIHALASEYPRRVENALIQEGNSQDAKIFARMASQYPSFAEAVLDASKVTYQPAKGTNIFFYGAAETFPAIPFWELLDPEMRGYHLRNQTFTDKIVLIGPTAEPFKDSHLTPFGDMPGVEINANAIATLLENRSISEAIPTFPAQGVFVGLLVLLTGYVQSRGFSPSRRFAIAIGLGFGWLIISYSVFVAEGLILPTAIPVAAIVVSGTFHWVAGIKIEKLKRRRAAQQYAASQDVQNFINASEDSDLQNIIDEHTHEIIGRKLDGRYEVLKELGSGGFGKTYKARDMNRPGHPRCVVKQLCPINTKPRALALAKKLFKREAKTLEKLGKHDQIPQLLAYREDELYLVQEYIEGNSLSNERKLNTIWGKLPERTVVAMMQEILQILEFVHDNEVIHRDIKPDNIIRRKSDGKLVLIDFGAVKEIEKKIEQEDDSQAPTSVTIAIGTDGFMAPEQANGHPSFSSDIYSTGIIGIQALTGMSGKELNEKRDPKTGELSWKKNVQVSHTFAEILDKMVRFNYSDRYQSATEVLEALNPLVGFSQQSWEDADPTAPDDLVEDDCVEGILEETKVWFNTFSSTLETTDIDSVDQSNAEESDKNDATTG